jgi:nicotinamidase/pyrazinamidase
MQITSTDVLIVIDVQNDFCPGGALPVDYGHEVIAVIHKISPSFEHIVLTQDWHPPGHISFASTHPGRKPFDSTNIQGRLDTLWPDHCVQGTFGAELHRDLNPNKAELILRKGYRPELDSYSAFFENDHATPTGLAGYLRERGLDRVFLTGLAYDYCVGFSALDARQMGFSVVVIQNACRAIDHDDSVTTMEEQFDRSGILLISSEDISSTSAIA